MYPNCHRYRRLTARNRMIALLTMVFVGLSSALVLTSTNQSSPATVLSGNPSKGKVIYSQICVACHGDRAQGNREMGSPALHAQEQWYMVSQLQKFRTGIRGADSKDTTGTTMGQIAKALPDDQAVNDVVVYISGLDGPTLKAEVVGDVAAGRARYRTVCIACHGDRARGKPELKAPTLIGQNDWYIVAQLQKFRQGQRGADSRDVTGQQMKAIVSTLRNDQAVNDIAAYIATLK